MLIAAFTPAQHVARQQVATSNMLLACCPQIVARNKQHVARNMLRWCKRGLSYAIGQRSHSIANLFTGTAIILLIMNMLIQLN